MLLAAHSCGLYITLLPSSKAERNTKRRPGKGDCSLLCSDLRPKAQAPCTQRWVLLQYAPCRWRGRPMNTRPRRPSCRRAWSSASSPKTFTPGSAVSPLPGNRDQGLELGPLGGPRLHRNFPRYAKGLIGCYEQPQGSLPRGCRCGRRPRPPFGRDPTRKGRPRRDPSPP